MKIKTAELTGPALDWAVAKCEELLYLWDTRTDPPHPVYKKNNKHEVWGYYAPSTDWSQGGPIIERECISISDGREFPLWTAWLARGHRYMGKTPLIAAMRCYVASRLGAEVEVPEELTS